MPFMGRSVPRLEDQSFLTGTAVYADDLNIEGQLYGVVVRSTHAHAEIKSIDVSTALEMPGVVAVYVETDLAADGVGHLPCGAELPPEAGLYVPPRPALAQDAFVMSVIRLRLSSRKRRKRRRRRQSRSSSTMTRCLPLSMAMRRWKRAPRRYGTAHLAI